jgi:hypothetical protein
VFPTQGACPISINRFLLKPHVESIPEEELALQGISLPQEELEDLRGLD